MAVDNILIDTNAYASFKRGDMAAVDHETAQHYADIYKELRQKGKPIPTNDLWIAATAVQYNLAVFTYDEHFKAVSRIRTGNRLVDFIPL